MIYSLTFISAGVPLMHAVIGDMLQRPRVVANYYSADDIIRKIKIDHDFTSFEECIDIEEYNCSNDMEYCNNIGHKMNKPFLTLSYMNFSTRVDFNAFSKRIMLETFYLIDDLLCKNKSINNHRLNNFPRFFLKITSEFETEARIFLISKIYSFMKNINIEITDDIERPLFQVFLTNDISVTMVKNFTIDNAKEFYKRHFFGLYSQFYHEFPKDKDKYTAVIYAKSSRSLSKYYDLALKYYDKFYFTDGSIFNKDYITLRQLGINRSAKLPILIIIKNTSDEISLYTDLKYNIKRFMNDADNNNISYFKHKIEITSDQKTRLVIRYLIRLFIICFVTTFFVLITICFSIIFYQDYIQPKLD